MKPASSDDWDSEFQNETIDSKERETSKATCDNGDREQEQNEYNAIQSV